MLRRLTRQRNVIAVFSTTCASFPVQQQSRSFTYLDDHQSSGKHDLAPREDEDFELKDPDQQILPGVHPLPLNNEDVKTSGFPLVSPFMPSPARQHPYWKEPPPEFPFFECSTPIVYTRRLLRERIIVPVVNLKGEIQYTRELDPYVFGRYPENDLLHANMAYWLARHRDYATFWDYETREIWRKAKKNWANTGTGMGRVSTRKNHKYPWGGRNRPSKPWNSLMPTCQPTMWHTSNRMALTTKMLQGKLMVVDRLSLESPSTDAFVQLCAEMQWDARHFGAGVLFVDGGSRLAPSLEFDTNFFYGSFFNGRVKVVRPTLAADTPYDYNKSMSKSKLSAPKGQKNPVAVNRFNAFDALSHHLLVVTEGAVLQMEKEMHLQKLYEMPAHIRNQLPDTPGMMESPLLQDCPMPLQEIELEAAARREEIESRMYEPFYDNPYDPWGDEDQASYEVDGVEGVIRRHTPDRPGGWKRLD